MKPFSVRSQSGFTLVELIVSLTVLLLLGAAFISNYNNFNRTQQVKQAVLLLKNNLRYAQTLAVAAQRPSGGCTVFNGYLAVFAGNSYTISASCDGAALAITSQTTYLPVGVTFTPPPPRLLFLPLSGRADIGSSNVVITVTGPAYVYHLSVSPAGNMADY